MKHEKYKLIKKHLLIFLQTEIKKTGLKNAIIGLSGGIDSAVVAVLLQEVFKDDFLAVMLPSSYSSKESLNDANELCDKFNIKNTIVSIKPFVDTYLQNIEQKPSNTDIGNFCARMRMSLLYDLSAKKQALVVGTSNKTELLLGYGTIFADLSSALNPIGDLYKSEIFEFARFLDIPDSILNKKPSADLYQGQSDEEDLGYTYDKIDSFLKKFIDDRVPLDILKTQFDNKLIASITKRISTSHFKRHMPIIAKISKRTIGHDFLYPRDMGL